MTGLSGNPISNVWLENGWVYKKQMDFLTENEYWCFKRMASTGFVPICHRVTPQMIRTSFVKRTPITDPEKFSKKCHEFLVALRQVGIRHGDLTEYSVIPHKNIPIVIDWAESRLSCDPRVDKRPEGDVYWMQQTVQKYLYIGVDENLHNIRRTK